jgi:hypothetical protein
LRTTPSVREAPIAATARAATCGDVVVALTTMTHVSSRSAKS